MDANGQHASNVLRLYLLPLFI